MVPAGKTVLAPAATGAPLRLTAALSTLAMAMRWRLFTGVAGSAWAEMVAWSKPGPAGAVVMTTLGRGLQNVGIGVGGGGTGVAVGIGVAVGGIAAIVNGALVTDVRPGAEATRV